MKIKMLRRTLQGSGVVPAGDIIETDEHHGRELIRKGWAEAADGDGGRTDGGAKGRRRKAAEKGGDD